MTPSEKTPQIDDFITKVFGIDRKANITNNVCTMCGKPATTFKDELSKKEFSISGMCQECQNKVF